MQDKVILFFFSLFIFLAMIGCNQYEVLDISISNYTYSEFLMSVSFLNDSEEVFINKRNFSQEKLQFQFDYDEMIYIKMKIIEKETGAIISEKELGFPGEGIGSANTSLYFVIDILSDEQKKYNVIYSLETFTYGLIDEDKNESDKK